MGQFTLEKAYSGCSDHREARMEMGDQLEGSFKTEVMWLGWGRRSLKGQPAGSVHGLNVGSEGKFTGSVSTCK